MIGLLILAAFTLVLFVVVALLVMEHEKLRDEVDGLRDALEDLGWLP